MAALALALAVAGCGGDNEQSGARPRAETSPTTSETAPAKSERAEQPPATAPSPIGTGKTGSPEQQPGGAGDEEPARSLAFLTGRGGAIGPRVVRVPPYISIRVELRSADGLVYELRFGSRRLRAGGQLAAASTTFAGLRTGRALVGRHVGRGNDVRIEASAEPGP